MFSCKICEMFKNTFLGYTSAITYDRYLFNNQIWTFLTTIIDIDNSYNFLIQIYLF